MIHTLDFVVQELNEKSRNMVCEIFAMIILAILTIWAFIMGSAYCVGFATFIVIDIIAFSTSLGDYKYYEEQLKEHVEYEEQMKN